jgi:hypothetical protein
MVKGSSIKRIVVLEWAVPPYSADIWNYDEYANRIGKGVNPIP